MVCSNIVSFPILLKIGTPYPTIFNGCEIEPEQLEHFSNNIRKIRDEGMSNDVSLKQLRSRSELETSD